MLPAEWGEESEQCIRNDVPAKARMPPQSSSLQVPGGCVLTWPSVVRLQ